MGKPNIELDLQLVPAAMEQMREIAERTTASGNPITLEEVVQGALSEALREALDPFGVKAHNTPVGQEWLTVEDANDYLELIARVTDEPVGRVGGRMIARYLDQRTMQSMALVAMQGIQTIRHGGSGQQDA